MTKTLYSFLAALALLAAISCKKEAQDPTPDRKPEFTVPAEQSKHFMTAAKDLQGKMTGKIAGIKVLLQDSKYYAVGEKVLSVSYVADKNIAGDMLDGVVSNGSKTVSMTWDAEDATGCPAVMHGPEAGEYGILCLPGEYNGVFTVKTNRHEYKFTKSISTVAGKAVSVTLDFAAPDVQPVRRVGILGDSISTYYKTLFSPEYNWFYPRLDPNVNNPDPALAAKAVDSEEKTWWWKVIYEKMQYGTLDINNSWSGTRVVHEQSKGVTSGQMLPSGFVDRAYNFKNPDIIIIHGGTNDVNASTPLGSFDWDKSIDELDDSKYRSAMIKLVKMLQARYEGVHIIILIGDRLTSGYAEANKSVANHFGLPYVNFVGMTIDKCKGSHPDANGFQTMADTIYETCVDYLP